MNLSSLQFGKFPDLTSLLVMMFGHTTMHQVLITMLGYTSLHLLHQVLVMMLGYTTLHRVLEMIRGFWISIPLKKLT